MEIILKDLSKEVTCTICLDLYTEPVTLVTCQHSFCLECFKTLFSQNNSPKSIPCPICKKPTSRRLFYANEQLKETVAYLKIYEPIIKSLDSYMARTRDSMNEGKNDTTIEYCDSVKRDRLQKWINECIVPAEDPDIISLVSSEESETGGVVEEAQVDKNKTEKKLDISELLNAKAGKKSIRKTKSLNCIITKVKSTKRTPRHSTGTLKLQSEDLLKIDEFNTQEIIKDQENRLINLIEEDCLNNIENEMFANNKEITITRNKKKKTLKKHESNIQSNINEADTSKKDPGWSRMKDMKHQIKKKQKFKQLKLCTENNKSKTNNTVDSKTAEQCDSVGLIPVVKLVDFENYLQKNMQQDDTVQKQQSDVPPEEIKQEKKPFKQIDDLLEHLEDNLETMETSKNNKDVDLEEDVFSLLTQKLNLENVENKIVDTEVTIVKQQKRNSGKHKLPPVDIDDIETCAPKTKKPHITSETSNTNDNVIKDNLASSKIIVDVVVHKSNDSLMDIQEDIHVEKPNIDAAESEDTDFISGTRDSPKIVPKKRKRLSSKQNTHSNDTDKDVISGTENANLPEEKKSVRKSRSKKIEENTVIEPVTKSTKRQTKNTKSDTNKSQEIKSGLISAVEQRTVMLSSLQDCLNSSENMMSQCANHLTNSDSLFSGSPSSKENIMRSSSDMLQLVETSKKSLVDRIYSLPILSGDVSKESIEFYNTAIPCLKKIRKFYEQICGLSQKISQETEKFTELMDKRSTNLSNTKTVSQNLILSLHTSMKHHVEIQTDSLKCPKCSYIFNNNYDSIVLDPCNSHPPVIEEQDHLNDLNNIDDGIDLHTSSSTKVSDKSVLKETQNILHNHNNQSSSKINLIEKEASETHISTGSDIINVKKVNRQLNFSHESVDNQNRKFKRIRSPQSDSDSESVNSKKSKKGFHSKLLYRDDIDVVFNSEASENINQHKNSQNYDDFMRNYWKKHDEDVEHMTSQRDKSDLQGNESCNTQDNTSKYISILEREYREAQFTKNNTEKVVDINQIPRADNMESSMHNSVLDNLLCNVSIPSFEPNDIITTENKNSAEKTQSVSLFSESQHKTKHSNTQNKCSYNNDAMSASLFLESEREAKKNDPNTTVINVDVVLACNEAQDKRVADEELDKEVEGFTSFVVEDSFGSEKDLFEDDNIVESTPQKVIENKSRYEADNHLLVAIEPPATVCDDLNTEWLNNIAPPPEFQDTDNLAQPIQEIQNITSMTPDLLGFNATELNQIDLNRGFFDNHSEKLTTVEAANTNDEIQNLPVIEEVETENVLNITPNNKLNSTNIESRKQTLRSNNKNLNPIVLAQRDKFLPLQVTVSANPPPQKQVANPATKQKSILNYMSTSQKSDASRSSSPIKIIYPLRPSSQTSPSESSKPTKALRRSTPFNKTVNKTIESEAGTSQVSKQICIACSRLRKDETMSIISMVNRLHVRFTKDFNKNVTHLVVLADKENRIKDHTIKYVQALAHSVWVVSFDWVRDSLSHNRVQPEEPYEVLDVSGLPGPRISRLTRESNPLLKNFVIHCAEPFKAVSKQELEYAIISLGGEIRKRPDDLLKKNDNEIRLILAECEQTNDFDQYQMWREALDVLVLDMEWLSRSVGQYQLVSVRPYVLCLENGMEDLGYPEELLAAVPESISQLSNTIQE